MLVCADLHPDYYDLLQTLRPKRDAVLATNSDVGFASPTHCEGDVGLANLRP